jgi:hypothetical protein
MIAAIAEGSSSKTRAGPLITGFFRPVIFATGALGREIALEDRQVDRARTSGLPIGRITSWSARGAAGSSARVAAMVLPVIVMQSPCRMAGVEQHLHHLRDAAGAMKVDRRCLPDGFRSQSTGTFLRMRSKSSIVHSTSGSVRRWRGSGGRRWSIRRWP